MSLRKCCGYRGLHSQMRQAEGLFQDSKGRESVSMKAKAKSILKPMKDALMLFKAQERMRRKHGDAIKKASPPFYSSAECVEQEQHFTPAQIAKQWGVSVYTVRRLFADVPGVLKIGQKGKHVSLRVPGRLLKAYHAKMSACRAEVHADRNQDRGAKADIRINITRS